MEIPFLHEMPQKLLRDKYFCVLDGIFGYSFKGTEIRQPFKGIIEQLKEE